MAIMFILAGELRGARCSGCGGVKLFRGLSGRRLVATQIRAALRKAGWQVLPSRALCAACGAGIGQELARERTESCTS